MMKGKVGNNVGKEFWNLSCGAIFPSSLIDVLAAGEVSDEGEGEEFEMEIDDEIEDDSDQCVIIDSL